ncbi:hypothetical protein [Proteiniphilum acetatigenes]|mgnify:CR=1 FL=1|uniref:hypothetical protein n=1 Tax=Proteiniphilum acetatigenes TaxID=294710 RepID=UPI0003652260|nr:hypothetical protein [Proteiniphilum acetatigenes]
MKEFKGAKGPWKLESSFVGSEIINVRSSDDMPVCSAYGCGGRHYDIDAATRNAQLISAAPEIFESLQEFVSRDEKRLQRAAKWFLPKRWFRKTYAAVEKGRKAINKALQP